MELPGIHQLEAFEVLHLEISKLRSVQNSFLEQSSTLKIIDSGLAEFEMFWVYSMEIELRDEIKLYSFIICDNYCNNYVNCFFRILMSKKCPSKSFMHAACSC